MYEKECVPVTCYQSLFHLAAIVFYLLKWWYHLLILLFYKQNVGDRNKRRTRIALHPSPLPIN